MTKRTKRLLALMAAKPKLRRVSGLPPLTYWAKKAGTLTDYRIYGQTENGESVGDRTGNLFDCDNTEDTEVNGIVWSCKNQIITANGATGNLSSSTFGHKRITGLYGSFILACVSDTNNDCICVVSVQETPSSTRTYYVSTTNSYATFSLTGEEYEVIVYAQVNKNKEVNNAQFFISLTEGSTPPDTYEPYGYRVPVTVTNDNNSQTTNLYLPEQIKKVGDEAEYIDYGEQKQHRVRKNLLQNTATSQTIQGVTFTVNTDYSVTCNGTVIPNKVAVFKIPVHLLAGAYIVDGCPQNGDVTTYSVDLRDLPNGYVIGQRDTGFGFTFTNDTEKTVDYAIRINTDYTCNNLTFYPMIRKADIEDDTYEPYITNTELDVTIPALPTVTGTNVLSVGTEVQPSEVEIEGRIKPVVTGGGD